MKDHAFIRYRQQSEVWRTACRPKPVGRRLELRAHFVGEKNNAKCRKSVALQLFRNNLLGQESQAGIFASFRVQSTLMVWLFHHREPSLLETTKKEQQEAIENLISQGTLHSGYYLMLFLATLIVTPGLMLNNVAVIIGGMILAPFIVPILSLSLALVSGNLRGTARSLKILIISILIAFLTSALIALVLSRAYHVVSWIPEQISPGIYIFIAFCSGVAGAFAWVKKNLAPTIAGVAIAVSILPPLCAAGIGLALGQYLLMKNSLILLAANFIGMCMAAFLVFWVLGFLDAGKVEDKVIKESTPT